MTKLQKVLTSEWFWLGLILTAGVFLRFWQLQNWQFFTYDQARDYLIIKRLILDHKLTLVGPTVLAPGVYLPPFYYYSLVPFLYLFNYHLLGPDVYTALLGISAIFFFYLLVKDLFGYKTALLSTGLFSLNPYLIHASRHAWNPNTIYFFTILFAFSFLRYLFKGNSNYLQLAAFSISWALNLHYTVIVFIPLLWYLFFLELKSKKISRQFVFSLLIFVFFISPIFVFELRHNFPNLKGVLSFVANSNNQTKTSFFMVERLPVMLGDLVKMPITLLTGLDQSLNLTVNPSHIVLYNETKFLSNYGVLFFARAIIGLFFVCLACFFAFRGIGRRGYKLVLTFLVFGFLLRIVFPLKSFYFYHYTFLFPFVFLLISILFDQLAGIKNGYLYSILLLSVVTFLSLYPGGLKNEIKTEKFFLPACRIVANDYSANRISVTSNLKDPARWDHNALEYRYFLETVYHLNLGNWEAIDYKNSDILYLIDEGDLTDPLKMGGMEIEAFYPRKIVQKWITEDGKKIYKMTK